MLFLVEVKPISTNMAYRIVRFGKRGAMVITKEGKQYKERIHAEALYVKSEIDFWDQRADVRIRIDFWFGSPLNDIDGPLKLTLDALQGALVLNDRQVADVRIVKHLDVERPRVLIHAWPVRRGNGRRESGGAPDGRDERLFADPRWRPRSGLPRKGR